MFEENTVATSGYQHYTERYLRKDNLGKHYLSEQAE